MGEMQHLPRHHRARFCWRVKEPSKDPAVLCSQTLPMPSMHEQHLPLLWDCAEIGDDGATKPETSHECG